MKELITIFLSGGFSVVLASAVAFLFRNWIGERLKNAIRYEYDQKVKFIENQFEMKIEAYKDKLKSESDKELLRLTTGLKLKAQEKSIKLTKTFDSQAEMIAITYRKLARLLRHAKEFMKNAGDCNLSEFTLIVEKFRVHIENNKIYFPRKNSDQIIALTNAIHNVVFLADILESNKGTARTPQEISKLKDGKKRMIEWQNTVGELLKLLEGGFQELLGFPDHYPKSEVDLFTEELAAKSKTP